MIDTALRYLYEAAHHGSMRLAGEKIGVAVSSISRQIARLEAIYGLPLIEHGRRNIRLTEAGQAAVDYYKEVLSSHDNFVENLRNLREMKGGKISISLGEGFIDSPFCEFIESFRQKHTNIEFTITVGSTADVIRNITDDEAHVGLIFHSTSEPKIRVRASVAQPLSVVSVPDHPITKLPRVTMQDLAKFDLCLMPVGYRIRNILAAVESKNKLWLKPAFTTNSIYMTRKIVKAGLAVTILPPISILTDLQEGSVVVTHLDEPELEGTTISLICRLGRQLPTAPLLFASALEAQLRHWAS